MPAPPSSSPRRSARRRPPRPKRWPTRASGPSTWRPTRPRSSGAGPRPDRTTGGRASFLVWSRSIAAHEGLRHAVRSDRQVTSTPVKRVSVVIPTFERAARLPGLVAALEAQTLPRDSFDVIVADDASRDETAEVLEELRSRATIDLRV